MPDAAPEILPPRAEGRLRVGSARRAGRSRIATLEQAGALRALFPRSGDRLEAIFTNTAGGVTGGDRLALEAQAGTGSHLSLASQAAERVYRAREGESGRIRTRLVAAESADLHWLPQETILFDGCSLDRRLEVDLHPAARFLMVEPLVFGRRAMGETLNHVRLRDRVRIRRGGALAYLDGIDIAGDAAAALARPATGAGAGAMASVVRIGPGAAGDLAALRRLLPADAGASLLDDDILVLRLLAEDAMALRAVLLPVLDRLTGNRLPRCWRL